MQINHVAYVKHAKQYSSRQILETVFGQPRSDDGIVMGPD